MLLALQRQLGELVTHKSLHRVTLCKLTLWTPTRKMRRLRTVHVQWVSQRVGEHLNYMYGLRKMLFSAHLHPAGLQHISSWLMHLLEQNTCEVQEKAKVIHDVLRRIGKAVSELGNGICATQGNPCSGRHQCSVLDTVRGH